MNHSYILYDTALFTNAAGGIFSLFQVGEGGDATHTSDFTNSRGYGSLPQNEQFVVRKIGVTMETNYTLVNVDDWFLNGYLRMYLANLIVLQIPLLAAIQEAGYNGHYTQAAAADLAFIGRVGMGYKFDPELTIKGGDAFKVEVYQGTAVSAASTRVKVMLDGILTRP